MNILLIGDSCMDVFIRGTVERLCPEAPVPVLNPTSKTINPGMAANVEANLKSLCPEANVTFITQTSAIMKTRYVDKTTGYILLRVDEGDKIVEKLTLESLLQKLPADFNFNTLDALVISDYNKGFLTESNLKEIIDHFATNSHAQIYMDTKKILGPWCLQVDYVKINSKEYQEQLKHIHRPQAYCSGLIVTLGEEGSKAYLLSSEHHVQGQKVEVMDVSGAGDTYLAALVVSNHQVNTPITKSMAYANKAAAVAVSKHGVVAVKKSEVGV